MLSMRIDFLQKSTPYLVHTFFSSCKKSLRVLKVHFYLNSFLFDMKSSSHYNSQIFFFFTKYSISLKVYSSIYIWPILKTFFLSNMRNNYNATKITKLLNYFFFIQNSFSFLKLKRNQPSF